MSTNPWMHRSENLHITWDAETRRWEIEIRFPSSIARGSASGVCPRCGGGSRVEHWQLEGPDGLTNTLSLECGTDPCCQATEGGIFRWRQTAVFRDGWSER
jgi:hypothetical protein